MMNIWFALAVTALAFGAEASKIVRLVGGSNAAVGEFPYQVSLRMNGQHFCGGALITKKHVLTAAHCVAATRQSGYPLPVTAVVGTNSIRSGGKSYRVSARSEHPQYVNKQTTDWLYDIGVLTLSTEVVLSDLVGLVKLPTKDVVVNTEAVVSGWGMVSSTSSVSPNLQKLTLKIIDLKTCQAKMPSFARIHSSHICTFVSKGKGTCSGDSGGPLVQDGVIIGVVSGGIPCAIGHPDVFTDIYTFLSYVKKAIGQ